MFVSYSECKKLQKCDFWKLKTMQVEFNCMAFVIQRDFDQEVSDDDFEVSLKVYLIFALLQFMYLWNLKSTSIKQQSGYKNLPPLF